MFVWLVDWAVLGTECFSGLNLTIITRGVEAVQKKTSTKDWSTLNKELEENPKNGYAYAWLSVIRNHNEEYGRPISALDMALKYIPSKISSTRYSVIPAKPRL